MMGGVYRYDGTFYGLLTLLARIIPERIIPEAIDVDPPPQQSLFSKVTAIATDQEIAEEILDKLKTRLTPSCLKLVRHAFLADHPGRELMILRYLLLTWEVGKNIGGMLAHPNVEPLWKLSQQVGIEAHRYKGFVRFRETTGGFFYSSISPEHRILPLIAPHIAARFSDQHWLIHDLKHGEAIVHDRNRREWLILPMETYGEPDTTPAEVLFQNLWRRYFTTLAIEARKNTGLQRSKVPLKVRPQLVEFAEPGEGNSGKEKDKSRDSHPGTADQHLRIETPLY